MKIAGLNGYRGFALICIITYHLNQIRPIQNLALWDWKLYQFFSLLPVAVGIFFILGGFLRSLSYWKVVYGGGEIPPFWKGVKDRIFRIAPLYYLALLASFLWSAFLGVEDWKSFLVGFTFFSWMHPSTFFPVALNGPLWFVAYDMMGNLIVMIFMTKIFWFLRKIKIRKFWIVSILFFLGFAILLALHSAFVSLPYPKLEGIVSVWFPYYNPFIFGIYYLFGALIAGIYLHLKVRNMRPSLIGDALFILSLLGIGYFLTRIRGATDLAYSFPVSPFRFPFVPFLLGVSIFGLLFSKYISKWIDNRGFVFFGKISYPLYLFHALIIVMIQYFFFGERFQSFREWSIFSSIVLTISLLVSTVLIRLEGFLTKKYLSK